MGLLIEVVGNVCVQWALGVVGLAVTVPAVYRRHDCQRGRAGTRLAGRTGFPALGVGHRVAVGRVGAVGIGAEAEAAGPSLAGPRPARSCWCWAWPPRGLAGSVFAMLNITIRHSVTRTTLPTGRGLSDSIDGRGQPGAAERLAAGNPSLWRTPWEQLALMAAAGIFNLIGFLA